MVLSLEGGILGGTPPGPPVFLEVTSRAVNSRIASNRQSKGLEFILMVLVGCYVIVVFFFFLAPAIQIRVQGGPNFNRSFAS
jgi:hypothetical protein